MSNLHQPYFSTKGLEFPEFKYNIFLEAVKPVSSVPLDDASRSERARRERAERKER